MKLLTCISIWHHSLVDLIVTPKRNAHGWLGFLNQPWAALPERTWLEVVSRVQLDNADALEVYASAKHHAATSTAIKYMAKVTRGDVGVAVPKVGMVPGVEQFPLDLQANSLVEHEVLEESRVPEVLSRSHQDRSTAVAVVTAPAGRYLKGINVIHQLAGPYQVPDVADIAVADTIRPPAKLVGVGRVNSGEACV